MNPTSDNNSIPFAHTPLGELWSRFIRRLGQQYGRYELRPEGVYCTYEASKDEDYPKPTQFVCSWLEVTAQSRDAHGQEWGYVLKWKDPDRRIHTWSAPRSLLVKYGTELVEVLAKGGLKIVSPKDVKYYISSVNPSARILNVPRPGWYTASRQRVFVLP